MHHPRTGIAPAWRFFFLVAIAGLVPGIRDARAEVGHFVPGAMNLRDYLMPAEPGIYGVLYNVVYTSDRLNDRDNDEIRSVHVGGSGPLGRDVKVEVDLDLYALAPTVVWVSDWKVLGARYGAFLSPTFTNASVNASLGNQGTLGREANNDSFGVGDLLVQPLWFGWDVPHVGASLAYGFYAPVGQYDTRPVTLPDGSTVRVESPDNLGYGYWTHQFQAAGAWYPWADKRMAVVLAGTYEINENKRDYDLTAGDVFTLNWGVSQYLPLSKDQSWLAELGITGYDNWQVSEDRGSDASSDAQDNDHAAGFQTAVANVPWDAAISLHYFYEFAADDRLQGHVIGISLAKKLY
jgi:hypothetical protein